MAIPHIFEWHQGAPEKLRAGMLIDCERNIELIGSVEDGISPEDDYGIDRWCWAISMANRR